MAGKAGKGLNLIHLVGGEKGGVGKTTVCRAFITHTVATKQKFVLVEADEQIADVGPIYAAQAEQAHTILLSDDPKRATEPDTIFEAASRYPVIVNLPSNTQRVLERWIDQTDLLDLMEDEYGGIYLVKWFVTDGCYESISQLQESLQGHDGRIPHIVVLNSGRIVGPDFNYLDDFDLYQKCCKEPNFLCAVKFPALESRVQFVIDRYGWTLDGAEEKISEEMGLLAKQRIVSYRKQWTATFEEAIAALDEHFSGGATQKKKTSSRSSKSFGSSKSSTSKSGTSKSGSSKSSTSGSESKAASSTSGKSAANASSSKSENGSNDSGKSGTGNKVNTKSPSQAETATGGDS